MGLILFFLMVTTSAYSESRETPSMVFPWQLLGLPAESIQNANPSLVTESKQAAGSTLFPEGFQPLEAKKNQPLLQKTIFAPIITSKNNTLHPVAFIPGVCAFGDRYLVSVRALALKEGLTVASVHTTILRKDWDDATKQKKLAQWLKPLMQPLWSRASQQVAAFSFTEASGLKIGLSEGTPLTRKDQVSSQCLNHLVSEKLMNLGYKITVPSGEELFASIHSVYSKQDKSQRVTRQLTLFWQVPQDMIDSKLQFPFALEERTLPSEAVFAIPMAQYPLTRWAFSIGATGEVVFTVPATLLSFLEQEKATLDLNTEPTIVKVYGAWAYVDKGRAWGFKINDRVVSRELGDQIKAHVIGFYGRSEGLKTAEGNPITEGAILFVRKGQRQTQIGQHVTLDPRVYP